MRVLHVTRDLAPVGPAGDGAPRVVGGVSTAVRGMVRALADAGVACAVVSFDRWRPRARPGAAAPPPAPREEGGVPVLRITAPPHQPAAHAFADAFRPDRVHVHAGMLWPFAAEIRRRRVVSALLTVHVLQAELNRLRGLDERTLSLAAQEEALSAADRVLAPSRTVAALLRALYPAVAGRIRVAPLGVHDGPSARAAAAAPRPDDGPVIHVGRFADVKGTDVLRAVIPRVRARRPGTTFVLAGGIPDRPRAEARWRRRWLADLEGAVHFAGWLDAAALAALYARAALLVAPSRFETFGLAVAEAMLHGVPVVAGARGALPELIDDGRTGLLVDPADPDAVAARILELLEDPVRARHLGRTAAATIRRERLWRHALPALLAAYADPS